MFGYGEDVFVVVFGQVYYYDVIFGQCWGQFVDMGQCVVGFKCGDDVFGVVKLLECFKCFGIGDVDIFCVVLFFQSGMFWFDIWIIQIGVDGMVFKDLVFGIL